MLRSTAVVAKCTKTTFRSAIIRGFHSSLFNQNASIFGMPAMSPTMEEGGVVEWHVKEGDAFASGDLLLEVETDKATIAVEAQDDGILAKILKANGEKGIKVGAPIAFLAEPGDNIAELSYPSIEESASPAPAAAAATASTPAPAPTPAAEPAKDSSSSPAAGGKADPAQRFFPSVEWLLETNNISREDALSKITASGPHGRILKGDVLAYLGSISNDSVTSISSYIASKSHLDLSHIELREATPAPAKADAKGATTAPAKPAAPAPVKISKEFVFSVPVTSEALATIISKASKKSEEYSYGSTIYAPSDLIDPIFEDLIAPARNTERFKSSVEIVSGPSASKSVDFFDDFDFEPYEDKTQSTLLPIIKVELTLNAKVPDAKERANFYIKYFGDYLAKLEERLEAENFTEH